MPEVKEEELKILAIQNTLDIRKETLRKMRDIHQPLTKEYFNEQAL